MKRILSIDGGGVLGIFPLSFLANIENTLKIKVSDYFDLIVGTSTGGIIALGLGYGFSSTEMLTFYKELCPKIFNGGSLKKYLNWLFNTKYDSAILRKNLFEKFENNRLGSCKTRLAIPSLKLHTLHPYVYKTAHHVNYCNDYKEEIVNIALSTSAAPTYFDACSSSKGTPLIDGGIWANNPTFIGAIEALHVLGWKQKEIKILSIGGTESFIRIDSNTRNLFDWAPKLLDTFKYSQSIASLNISHLLIGKENIFRINPLVAKGKFKLDNINIIHDLEKMGYDEAREQVTYLKDTFFVSKCEKFEPIYNL